MSYMLPVTLKRFNAVDWGKLKAHVAEHGDGLEDAVDALNTQREILRNTTERTENVLSQYYKYYAQIVSIDHRVAVSEQEVRVSFTWYDVYKERKVSQYSLAFERANILWNIIGLHTHLGAAEKRNSDESIKLAAKHFQTANGVVGMLKKELEAHPAAAATLDLTMDTLNLLSNITNAESQECYYDLAHKGGKMAPDAISKLAYQVGVFYQKAVALIEGSLKDSHLPRKWTNYCHLKQLLFNAIGFYHLSQDRLAASAYGEQLSRLQSAQRQLAVAQKERYDKYVSELTDFLNGWITKVNGVYASANKDNSTIYFEPVPPESKLAGLAGHVLARTVEPDPQRLTLSDDPFSKIVPFAVQKADSQYCEKRGDLLRAIIKKVEENDGLAKAILSELGLPASLDSLESGSSINTLQSKITTIQNEGGVSMLQERSALLDSIADADQRILHEALSMLDAEELEDKNSRSQYGSDAGWSRTASTTLNAHLRQEAQKFMANFEQARKSDEYIKSKFAALAPHINKLALLTRDALVRELPMDAGDSPATAVAAELRQRVAQTTALSAARATLVSQLRTMAQNDNILGKLLAAPNRDGDLALFDAELNKFSGLTAQLEATFATQAQLLQAITEQNTEFLASRRVTPAMEQRQAILQTYEKAFQAYCELKDHLKEGAEFYSKFQDLLNKFKTKCGDFALARKTELQEMIEDAKQRKLAASAPAPQASAPAPSPQTSNVMISRPTTGVTSNSPSSIYSSPYGYSASPQPQQGAAPVYGGYYAVPSPAGLPPGYTAVALPPGYTFQQPQQPHQQNPPGY